MLYIEIIKQEQEKGGSIENQIARAIPKVMGQMKKNLEGFVFLDVFNAEFRKANISFNLAFPEEKDIFKRWVESTGDFKEITF